MHKRDVSVIILVDQEKRILMQHRDDKATRFALQWGFFGGGIKSGETPVQALWREVREELSYSLHAPQLVWQQEYAIPECKEMGTEYVFTETYDGSPLHLSEGGEMKWCTLDEASNLPINNVDKNVLGFLFKYFDYDKKL